MNQPTLKKQLFAYNQFLTAQTLKTLNNTDKEELLEEAGIHG